MFLNTYTLQYQLSGGHLANDYDISFQMPSGKLDSLYPRSGLLPSDSSDKISVLCKKVTLPGKTITTNEFHHQGIKYSVQGTVENGGTIDMEFYNDKELTTRRFFEKWMKELQHHDEIEKKYEYDKYSLDIVPKTKKSIVGSFGTKDVTYKLQGVFPTVISDLDLDGTNVSELSTTTVTIAYSTWDNEEGRVSGLLSGLFN